MTGKNHTKKSLGSYIIKKYISVTLLLVLLISLISLVFGLASQYARQSDAFSDLCAENIVRPDYENIDIGALEKFDGWVEILNEDNEVVYTLGNVLEETSRYTQAELLEQAALQSLIRNRMTSYGIISFGVKWPAEDSPGYIATYAGFTGEDGRAYTCVVKFRAERLSGEFSYVNDAGVTSRLGIPDSVVIIITVASIAALALVLILCIGRYASTVRRHVTQPNEKLVQGLRRVTSGDFSARIHLDAEYEYIEIEESFNFLGTELEEAARRRQEYEEERRMLFANIAHDLKTPITTIRGYASAISAGLLDTPEKTKAYMETILQKTEHMNDMVERLLIYAKLDSADYPLHLEETDFAELTRQSVAELWGEAEGRAMNLSLEIPEQRIPVRIDVTEIRRVIGNLVINAIRHNPSDTEIRILVTEGESGVALEVMDNGTPIPAEMRKDIFKPFVCGDESRTSKNGSGLGLSICQKIVHKHGGTLELLGFEGGWKAFRLTLPR